MLRAGTLFCVCTLLYAGLFGQCFTSLWNVQNIKNFIQCSICFSTNTENGKCHDFFFIIANLLWELHRFSKHLFILYCNCNPQMSGFIYQPMQLLKGYFIAENNSFWGVKEYITIGKTCICMCVHICGLFAWKILNFSNLELEDERK